MKRILEATLLGLILVAIVALTAFPYLWKENFPQAQGFAQKGNNTSYSTDLKELKDKFNQDKGKVRLVLILSPTCGLCAWGASQIQRKVLEKIPDEDIRVYAVYLPILGRDLESDVSSAIKRLPDKRVSYFWDGKGEVGKSFARVLKTSQPAWDVYLVFNRNAEWKSKPPVPDYWVNQVSAQPQYRLNAERFAEETNKLLQTRQ